MRLSRRRFLAGAAGALGAAVGGSGCAPAGAGKRVIVGEIVGAAHRVGHLLRGMAAAGADKASAAAGAASAPGSEQRVAVVIVGAGVSGLSAAWKLRRAGVDDYLVLDLEPVSGGTARWGEAGSGPYPWGAHYLPLPTPESRAVRELLEDFGVIEGQHADGSPIYGERHLCYAPQERLFLHGRWQSGLFPTLGATKEDLAQLAAFRALMASYRARRDAAGRPAFALPMELSSQDPDLLALDSISMKAFLDQHAFTSERLRWYVEYACRDDYGCNLGETSAWAGIHYYASRSEGDEQQVLTWPEGNGWLARRLAQGCGARVRTGVLVTRVENVADGVVVHARDAASGRAITIRAGHAVLATPKFVTRRLVDAPPERLRDFEAFSYAPWVVANLHVDRAPRGTGALPSWDNVIYDSPSLGYIDASHQLLTTANGPGVLTYYLPFPGVNPAAQRQKMLDTSWQEWCDLVLHDLRHAHRDIDGLVSRIDVMLWGHAMVRPAVGFLWSAARRRAAEPLGRIQIAHADTSGLPLFEEAQYRGVLAAERILTAQGRSFRSSL